MHKWRCCKIASTLVWKSYQIKRGNPVSLTSLIQISYGEKTSNRLMQGHQCNYPKRQGADIWKKKALKAVPWTSSINCTFFEWIKVKRKRKKQVPRTCKTRNIFRGVRFPIEQKEVPILQLKEQRFKLGPVSGRKAEKETIRWKRS